MRIPVASLLALALFLGWAEPRPAAAEVGEEVVLDRVVATVDWGEGRGHRVILTWSDLELEARVALLQRGAIGAADAPLPADTLAASLEWLIAEHLLFAEADQLGLAGVDGEEIVEALAGLRQRFPDEESFERFLERQEAAEELPRILRRRIVVDRYLASRLRLGGAVTDEQVAAAWEARRGELGSMSLQEARAPLRAQLEKEQRERIVRELVSDLRARAEVRVLHDFGSGGAGP